MSLELLPEQVRSKILVCDGPLPTQCWLWQGSDSGTGRGGGYGRVRYKGRTWAVHRLVFYLLVGRLLPPKKQLDHECENRKCCNPEHTTVCHNKRNNQLRVARAKRRQRATVVMENVT